MQQNIIKTKLKILFQKHFNNQILYKEKFVEDLSLEILDCSESSYIFTAMNYVSTNQSKTKIKMA